MTYRPILLAVLAAAATPGLTQTAPAASPVAKATYIARMESGFQGADANKDGKLSRSEIEAQQQREYNALAAARAAALFKQLDSDNNGQLTRAEFNKLSAATPKPNAQPLLAKLDGNKDGTVSLAEYRSAALSDFDKVDANKDGSITSAEVNAARQKR